MELFEQRKITDIFTCLVCANNRIEEIIPNVTLRTEVIAIYADGEFDYDNQHGEDGDTPYYQCEKCGNRIANDAEELKQILGLGPDQE